MGIAELAKEKWEAFRLKHNHNDTAPTSRLCLDAKVQECDNRKVQILTAKHKAAQREYRKKSIGLNKEAWEYQATMKQSIGRTRSSSVQSQNTA